MPTATLEAMAAGAPPPTIAPLKVILAGVAGAEDRTRALPVPTRARRPAAVTAVRPALITEIARTAETIRLTTCPGRWTTLRIITLARPARSPRVTRLARLAPGGLLRGCRGRGCPPRKAMLARRQTRGQAIIATKTGAPTAAAGMAGAVATMARAAAATITKGDGTGALRTRTLARLVGEITPRRPTTLGEGRLPARPRLWTHAGKCGASWPLASSVVTWPRNWHFRRF